MRKTTKRNSLAGNRLKTKSKRKGIRRRRKKMRRKRRSKEL